MFTVCSKLFQCVVDALWSAAFSLNLKVLQPAVHEEPKDEVFYAIRSHKRVSLICKTADKVLDAVGVQNLVHIFVEQEYVGVEVVRYIGLGFRV